MTDVTLNAFLAALDTAMPEAGVVFATEDGPVGAGYHITELKHARVDSIDCGGHRSGWDEAAVQVLDVFGDAPMPVERLRAIVTRSLGAIPALAEAPVHIEFGHRNQSLSRYDIAGLQVDDHLVQISMVRARATCKPAAVSVSSARQSCCA
ncbi:MAG: DUF6428 family protein [Pseudomonadota bacterium]